jgi:phosphatidylglycerol:prolipoprotein diacylglycerol transferase
MLSLAATLHTLDPFAIQLTDTFGLRWYGLAYLAGFLVGYLLIRRVCKVGISSLDPKKVGDLILVLAIGVVAGGRLGYVFFYQPDLLWQLTGDLPFWGVLAINQGGMASHGGIIGCILATGYYAWKHNHRWLHLLDLLSFGAPAGLFFGRLANYINGELYGRLADANYIFGVQFPQEAQGDPVLREALAEAYGRPLTRDWLERLQAGSEPLREAAAAVLPVRHPSQLYAAGLEGLMVFVVLLLLWIKPRRTGVVGAAFCITYAVGRFIGEFFRLPDEHLGLQWLDLSRGQWLSLPVLLTGVIALVVIPKLNKPRMGGWLKADRANEG